MRTVWFCEQDAFALARSPGVTCGERSFADCRGGPGVCSLVADAEYGGRGSLGGRGLGAGVESRGEGPRHASTAQDGGSASVSVPVPYVDVLCGGFPCQDISIAGRGEGIDGQRSGWPTPAAMDSVSGSVGRSGTKGRHALALSMLANSGAIRQTDANAAVERHTDLVTQHGTARSTWPTPHGICSPNGRTPGPSGNELGRAVNEAERPWPTPTARLGTARGAQAKRYSDPARSNDLDDAVAASGTPGSLNPTWVEWLMGFPLGWTDCGPSETRSSHRSRSGSDGGFSSTRNKR
jgi:hypothetical protein